MDRYQGHLYDKQNANATVARHFASQRLISNPEFIINVLECIKTANVFQDQRQLGALVKLPGFTG